MSKINCRNIFSGLPEAGKREVFQTLVRGKGFKIERIVSRGQATPKGKWLCSKAAEWVIVLRGRTSLRVKGARKILDLKAGDHVLVPANTCHRVDWTPSGQKTVWLAVHFKRS
ncbi:MAG: cupin domain-containing protein [Candidatus Omnitrophota bacterium]|jgi:cupin 2 domain-containing protein